MPLDAVVDSLDGVEDSVKSLYVQNQEGRFVLDVKPTSGYALENVEGLKSALQKERGRAKELETRVSSLGDIDPTEVQSKLQRLAELESLDPAKEADRLAETKVQAKVEQMAQKHQKDLQGVQGEVQKYKGQLQKLLVDDVAKSAILAAGGDERTVTYMLPHIKSQLAIEESENGFMTTVMDEHGNPRVGDSMGSPMTVQGLVEEMKSTDLWAGAFPGRKKSSGGTPQPTRTGGTPQGKKWSDLSTAEKTALIREHGGAMEAMKNFK